MVSEISDPSNPCRVGDYDRSGWYRGSLPFSRNFAYVPDPEEVWLVNDISDPLNPTFVGGYKTIASVFGVAVSGHYACVADGGAGLQVIDISKPGNPRIAGHHDTSADAIDVAMWDNYAYVAEGGDGMAIFEIGALPAISFHSVLGNELVLSWNRPAAGMRLQRATSLTNPTWQDVPNSENASLVRLPLTDAAAFFRLVKP